MNANQRYRLDRKVAILGLICSIGLIILGIEIKNGIGLAFTLFFASFMYLIISRKKNETLDGKFPSFLISRSKSLFLHIATTSSLFVILIVSLSCFQYSRPIAYFICVSIISAAVAVEILTLPTDKMGFYPANIAVQLVLLFASLSWSVFFEFPGLPISDPWAHALLTNYIQTTGHVIPTQYLMSWTSTQYAEYYGAFPFTHIIVSIFCTVTSLPYKVSLTLSIGFFEVISPFYVFLISRKIFHDLRISFFATLFAGINTWHVLFGTDMIPQSLGLSFFILAIYLFIGRKMEIPSTIALLVVLLSITLSHTVSSFILFVVVVALFLSKVFFQALTKRKTNKAELGRINLKMVLLIFVLVFSYWMLFSNFFDQRIVSLVRSIEASSGIVYPAVRSYFHFEVDQIGIYIFYVLALIGLFIWLRQKKTLLRFGVMFAILALAFFVYGSLVTGVQSILPERWFAFIFLIVALIASEGLVTLVKLLNRKKALAIGFVFLLFCSLTFAFITNSDANRDSPLLLKNEVVRGSYLESEMEGASTIAKFANDSIIITDYLFADYFWWDLQRPMLSINFSSLRLLNNSVVIERNYIYERPTREWDSGPYYVVPTKFAQEFQNLDMFYSNGEVRAYYVESTGK